MLKLALVTAIAQLDNERAMALYNALAAHVENEAEHVEILKDSTNEAERNEGEKAEKLLEGIRSVVEACELAIYSEQPAQPAQPEQSA